MIKLCLEYAIIKLKIAILSKALNFALETINLQKPCVPTASVKGPCHTCVCNAEAIFDCHAIPCDNQKTINPRISIKDECEPHMTYRFEELFCTCNYKGKWMSYNCRETFQFLRSDGIVAKYSLRSKINCTPNTLILIDCNICYCSDKGAIKSSSCTNRLCHKGHKADYCKFGDFLRTNNEICICSDINYYIDRLCAKVEDNSVQEINKSKINQIVENINPIRKSMINDSCIPQMKYTIDCNNCICDNNEELVCTNKVCDNNKGELKIMDHHNDFFDLPEVNNENDSCVPRNKYRFKCNTCICTDKMTLSCTTMASIVISSNYNVDANEIKYNELPEIEEGQSCIPDRLYKMACNTCRCGPNSTLVCTKIACLENKILEEIEYLKVKAKRRQNVESKEKKRKNQHTAILNFPKLPKGDCISGKIYSKGCRKCFCNESKIAVCTKTCSENSKYMLDDKEILQMESRSLTDLPELPHTGSQCEPGKSYYVDCNRCLCTDKRDLVCTFILCMTIDSFEKVYTDMLTGLPCKKDYKELCTECKCVKGKSECKTIRSCNIKSTKQLLSTSGRKIKLTLDTKKEKCVPNSTYKVHCNECHCQSDGALRCTQRVCLSYSQAKNLKEREEYLLKHGL
ncbi:unnamed protein product [Euphydryas editha]|uniref:Pacifastin domain-containing protein n=1 Tax=Euphydryas editha TaxID=104508 RepID=A0AAU9UHJ3_EUPED|nr:unnamed protein product [Euphydryas editha]